MSLVLHSEYLEITFRLVAALAAGGIIGLERSFRGRAAGFRTHALVCIASSLLMLVAAFAGLDNIRRAYAHAIERRYRFFSYGDAMLIEKAR